MHLGAELELAARPDLEAGIARVLARWPELGMTLARGLGGLRWRGEPRVAVEQGDPTLLARWRAEPIDPFRSPPLAVAWLSAERTLVVRCHHAAADGTLFLAILTELVSDRGAAPQVANVSASAVDRGEAASISDRVGPSTVARGEAANTSGRAEMAPVIAVDRGDVSDRAPVADVASAARAPRVQRASPLGFARLWRETRVRDAWRAARALEREAKQERS